MGTECPNRSASLFSDVASLPGSTVEHLQKSPPGRDRLRLCQPRPRQGRGVPPTAFRAPEATPTTRRPSPIPASTPLSSRCRRVSPGADAAGPGGGQARAGGEARVPVIGRDFQRVIEARNRADRVVLVGENDHYKPLAVVLRRLLAARRGRRHGVRAFRHHRQEAQVRPATGATTNPWREATPFSRKASTGCIWPAVLARRSPASRATGPRQPCRRAPAGDARAKSMMVAFRYDNGAVGSLSYSREVPSTAARAAAVEDLRPGRRHYVRIERRVRAGQGQGRAADYLPGVPRHPRLSGDVSRFLASHSRAARAADEPGTRARRSKADGTTLIERFDIVIIGTGAGGGTIAHALSDTGARILILERGDFVPQEEENWSPEAVWKATALPDPGAMARRARQGIPSLHALQRGRKYQVLGQRALSPAAGRLRGGRARRRRSSPAWPIDYDTLEPFYERAERLYQVRGTHGVDPTEAPRGAFARARPCLTPPAWRRSWSSSGGWDCIPRPLPLGLRDGCILCNTCNSFVCKLHAKSEADVCCVRPASRQSTSPCGPTRYARRLFDRRARRKHFGGRGGAERRDARVSKHRCSSCRAAP